MRVGSPVVCISTVLMSWASAGTNPCGNSDLVIFETLLEQWSNAVEGRHEVLLQLYSPYGLKGINAGINALTGVKKEVVL